MQNSSHALKPQKNETRLGKNKLSVNRPLYLYTDKKSFLLLKRTYYLKELKKTETLINNEKFMGEKFNLTNDEFKRLVSEFNNLINLQNLLICSEDLLKSLQLQNKIIKILKIFIINQIEEK